MDKLAVKKWIYNPTKRVVHKPVTHKGLVDIARFWIVQLERLVATVLICLLFELLV